MKNLALLLFRLAFFVLAVLGFLALFQAGPDGFYDAFLQEIRRFPHVLGG
jgi:hypothetical protein